MYISLFARARRPRVWFRDPATPRPSPAQGVVGSRNPHAINAAPSLLVPYLWYGKDFWGSILEW